MTGRGPCLGGRSIPRAITALLILALVGLIHPFGCRDRESGSQRPVAAGEPSSDLASRLAEAERLQRERRYQESEAIYTQILEEVGDSEDREVRWRALAGWARARLTLGDHAEAKEVLPELRSLAGGDLRLESRTARFAAAILHREGELHEAESESLAALDLARQAGDRKLEADASSMLATVYSLSARHEEALRIDEELVALFRETSPGSRDLALQLNEVGIDYRHFGRFGDAMAVYEEALAIYHAHEDDEGQAMVLYNLANVHSATGDIDRSLERKLESLKYAEKVGHSYGLGLLNKDIGQTYLEAGNLVRAREYLQRALEINRQANQAYGEILSLESLGRLELEASRPERAAELLHAALQSAEAKGYAQQTVTIRVALSRAAASGGDPAGALRVADEALEEARRSSDPELEFQALEAKGLALEATGRLGEAAAVNLEAIALLESWRGRLALGDLRMGVAHRRWEVFESAVRCLFRSGRIAEAFEVTERARARLLLDLMAERSGEDPPESEEREIRAHLRERFSAWQKGSAERRAVLEREIADLTERLSALESRARREEPLRAAARFPAPASLSDIQESLASGDRALVAYLWGERDVYGWWIERERVRGVRLGESAELGSRVEFLRAALEDTRSPADWAKVARRAYETFVAPMVTTTASEIVILADGPLSLVPFEALLPGDGALPWGVTRQIVYGPSASVLLALSRAAPVQSDQRGVLALGYSPEGPTVSGGAAAMSRGDRFSPIPEAPAEAQAVFELFRDEGSTLLTGDAATFERWMARGPEKYRYLHFATHATASDRRPERSHLLLANGPFTVPDIRKLRLDADLVTLSACETALGYRVRGEGVVGLAHAFLAAGARAALVSLWRVDDREAATFMRRYYGLISRGMRPAKALLETRRSWFLEGGGKRHPSVWASFVLVGSL